MDRIRFLGALMLGLGLGGLSAGSAVAQSLTRIWDLDLGSPVTSLPSAGFAEVACGTYGGPRGQAIAGFAGFAACPVEETGLRELWVKYDDTIEFIARAHRDPVQIGLRSAMAISGQPVILSVLVSEDGLVRGYRIFNDPVAEPLVRVQAHLLSAMFKAPYGTDWDCTDIPAAEGQTPVQGVFVNQVCTTMQDGAEARVEARFYHKPGQALLDPTTGKPMINAFESFASLEVVQAGPYEPATPPSSVDPVAREASADDEVTRFLAGSSNDCPGCDLAKADLRRRDLTGADLRGANLTGAVLHRAILRDADLSQAILRDANLNVTDLTFADLSGSELTGAMLFQARATRANLEGAQMDRALAGESDFQQANLAEAVLTAADLGGAKLSNASLARATLDGAYLYRARLLRADLTGASARNAAFAEAAMREALLVRATVAGSDFQAADLREADLTDADFSGVRLQLANMLNATQTGTDFSGALMPK